MPDIFDIDFNNQAEDLLPPDKRDVNTLSLLKGAFKALQRVRDTLLGAMKTGSTAPAWTATTYQLYDQVIYNKQVFESRIADNTAEPTDPAAWYRILPNFIGTDARQFFDGTKLLFEYALNDWFGSAFAQPTSIEPAPDYYLPKSDIYLTTNEIINPVFRVGISEAESSTVGLYDSSEAVGNDYSFAAQYGLTINIPNTLFLTLGASTEEREKTVRNFADKYITAGIFYDINPY